MTNQPTNTMHKVHIVRRGSYMEGGSILGVFSTPETAQTFVENYIAKEAAEADEAHDRILEQDRKNIIACGYEFNHAEWESEYATDSYWQRVDLVGELNHKEDTSGWCMGSDWLAVETHEVNGVPE
tara:strand:+ start:5765 stop:6142 length:378 start_codon:yes stop_codon:yes gene_type:complete